MKRPDAFALTGMTLLLACEHSMTAKDLLNDSLTLTLALDESHPATILASGANGAGNCSIVWTPGGQPEKTTVPAVEGGALSAVLVGSPASTEVTARMQCDGEHGPEATVTTGDLPPGLLAPTVLSPLSDSIDEDYFLTSGTYQTHGSVTMSDIDGNVVWWEDLDGSSMTAAHFDAETGIVYGVDGDGLALMRLAGPTVVFPAKDAHHDALSLGDGKYLVSQSVSNADGTVVGDNLSIVDTSDGSVTVVWDAFDQLEQVENDGWQFTPADWTHVNTLSRDESTGKIYASLYWDHSIVQIDPVTWQTDWVMGGVQSDFSVDVPFGPQHSFVRNGESCWMFDNGSDVTAGSHLSEYSVSDPVGDSEGTATLNWTWTTDPPGFDVVLGSVQTTDDAILASWGDTATIRILSPDREILAEYGPEIGGQTGYASFVQLD